MAILIGVAAILSVGRSLVRAGRVTSFNPRRAELRTSSIGGSNATLMLSAAALASLAVSAAGHAERWHRLAMAAGPLLAFGAVLAIVLLALGGRRAQGALGLVGFAAEMIGAGLDHGVAGAIAVLVIAMLLLMLLAFVRGFAR